MVDRAKFLIEVMVEPKPGYDMLRAGGDQYLFMASDDATRNILLDTDGVADILQDLVTGGPLDGFNHGLDQMWQFKLVVPPGDAGDDSATLIQRHQRMLALQLIHLYCRELVADDGSYSDSVRTVLARGLRLCGGPFADLEGAKREVDRLGHLYYQELCSGGRASREG